ncbi:MAG: hypothetical protein ABSD74_19470 [Rhizomicrobium sp.]|jgi:hypothetical protein
MGNSNVSRNLTGVWQGLYSYPRALAPVSFVATLIETESWLSGSTHEPHRKTGATLCATLLGKRAGNAVSVVKSYENPEGGYGADIRYDGTVSDDATEIEGLWTIRPDWSGRFLLVRGTPDAEAVARKKFARA